jgi:hypothetical protein
MKTFRFTTKTMCGKTDMIIEEADTLELAKAKYQLHIANKHSPMELVQIEVKWFGVGLSGWMKVTG